jgi:D-alanyl-D-alanine carboxypeptidase
VSERTLLQGGRRRTRGRQHRGRRLLGAGAVVLVLGIAAMLAFMAARAQGPTVRSASGAAATPGAVGAPAAPAPAAPPPRTGYRADLAPAAARVHVHFKLPVKSGLLFDVDTGQVMWRRDAERVLPIASLTKMMTALVVVAHHRRSERVLVTAAAVNYSGSGVGLLPFHKFISLETMLYGLLLPSGNDAAIALAQHVAGSERRFIALMNVRALEMGLRCTHFTTVSGLEDRGNHSCAADLAILARAVLEHPLLGKIVATPYAELPFPIKGGKLYLSNNNPLMRLRYAGTDGVKTGFTNAAGRCLVASARRGHRRLGVVLLHSDDPPDQARALLSAGFAALGP